MKIKITLLVLVISTVLVYAQAEKRPNVLMICVDDMNGYGVKKENPLFKTPYLDKLRKQSVNFINANCSVPVCNPSRSSFFSGLYPHHTGAYMNGSDGWNRSEILDTIRNLPECFKDNGYITFANGKVFHNKIKPERDSAMFVNKVYQGGFGPFPEKEYQVAGNFHSIKPWVGPDSDFPDVVNADSSIAFLKRNHEKPFFLYYGLWRPHSPYTAPKRIFEQYNESDFDLPKGYRPDDLDDVPFLGKMLLDSLKNYRNKNYRNEPVEFEKLWEKFIYAYAANYSFADWNVGRVIEALDSSQYANNTIVVFFSDNGFNNGEKLRWGKATLWEQSDYVPFIIRTPETKENECKATVNLIDIYPTLVDYCGLEAPSHKLDGKSIVPLLKNPKSEWNRPSLTSYGIEYSSVRDSRYRYLRYPDGSEELYDHDNDPHEFNNIVKNPELKEIIERLSKEIPKDWAPCLGGRLEVPRNFEEVQRPVSKFGGQSGS